MVTPEYSAGQRSRVAVGPLLAPHPAAVLVLDRDADRARSAARTGLGMFIGFPAYQTNLRRLGFTDPDFVPGGSDRLIDALTAWSDLDVVNPRVREHLDAGADHVALHVLSTDRDSSPGGGLPLREWRELAPLLADVARR
jgi:probable F420-dependent oxidoreductase